MFSHVTIGTDDLARAVAFYDAALAPLGIERVPSKWETWAAWRRPGEAATLWVGRALRRAAGEPGQRLDGRLRRPVAPRRGRRPRRGAGRRRAGRGRARPPRPHFAPDYYGAYVRDPDGNKLHFVRRGA
jgi:catechol 2,3-dioxygenase-like lactoylglutathione lyase family enzyme